MGFVEIRQEMMDGKLFREASPFFDWAKSSFQTLKGGDITAKLFAFQLLDCVGAEVEDKDEVFKRIIEQADRLGIKPWENVVGLRLQASTCLAEFIERGKLIL